MKTTFTVSAVLALLPAFITAAPLAERDNEVAFTLLSIHSGNEYVHLQEINANAKQFWIGRPTTTSCPSDLSVPCPPGTETVLVGAIGGHFVSTSHEVPGEQSVYIAGPDAPIPGALQFNAAHASPPAGSITDQFNITQNNLIYTGGDFYACPAMGAYYITTSAIDSKFCVDIAIHTIPYNGPQPAAWEYD